MPVDVGIGNSIKSYEYKFSFGPDVYYWILSQEIDNLRSTTGKFIDLYDHTEFILDELVYLDKFVHDSRVRAQAKPRVWNHYLGKIYRGKGDSVVNEDNYESAEREKLEMLIQNLESTISEARKTKLGIVFLGD